jgi:hypothetical protein
MKTLVDEMASAGKKFVYLDFEYNPIVSSMTARDEPISFGELYSQLLAHKNRLDIQNSWQQHSVPSVNNASHGRGGYFRKWRGCSTGPRGGSNCNTPMVL